MVAKAKKLEGGLWAGEGGGDRGNLSWVVSGCQADSGRSSRWQACMASQARAGRPHAEACREESLPNL